MPAALLVALSLSVAPKVLDARVGPRPVVEVANVAGPITVTAGPGEAAHVEARWEGGSEAEQARWTVDLQASEGHLQAQVCCGPCEGVSLHRECHGPARVALTLIVPAGSSLKLAEVSGDASISGLKGELKLNSVSGALRAEGSEGALEVNTVDGAVTLAPARLASAQLHAVNGRIKLELPRGTGADVRFHAVGGSLNGSPVTLGEDEERIGPGGARVDCNVVGGSLEVR